MRGLGAILIIAFIFASSTAVYDAESVKRAAIEDIIGKYYAYDPFLLPSRKGRFESYITEEQRAPPPTSVASSAYYEEQSSSDYYRPSSKAVESSNPKENVRYESTPATQYVVHEEPIIPFVAPTRQEYRENAYHNEKDTFEEGVPFLPKFRDVQPKRQRPSYYAEPFHSYQYPNVQEFKGEGRAASSSFAAPAPLKSDERKQYWYSDGMVRGAVFDEPRVTDLAADGYVKSDAKQNAEYYASFKGKPAKKNTRLLERETSLPTRASWSYGSDEYQSEFYPTLSQYRPKKTRGTGRSIRFSDDFTAFTERNVLQNGLDIASKVLWRSPLSSEDTRGPAVYAE